MNKSFWKDIGFWFLIQLLKTIVDGNIFRDLQNQIEMLDFKSIASEEKRQQVFDWLKSQRKDLSGNAINFLIESVLAYIRYHRNI